MSPSPGTATGVVGMARLLSDGVSNAYLLDVWTMSAYRRQEHRRSDGQATSGSLLTSEWVSVCRRLVVA
jgi:hypothetical protein